MHASFALRLNVVKTCETDVSLEGGVWACIAIDAAGSIVKIDIEGAFQAGVESAIQFDAGSTQDLNFAVKSDVLDDGLVEVTFIR